MRVARNEFARLLAQVTKAVESRNTIPILGHVRLVATAGTLTATTTDLDLQITGSMPAEGGDAAFCVDARMLAGIVGKASGDVVDLDLDDRLTVKCGRSRFTLSVLPVEDFPTMDTGSYDVEFDLDLAALAGPVQFAISTEETRYYLNGIYLHVTDGKVVAVATDGHRLAKHIGSAAPEFRGVIVPRKTVGLLPKGTVRLAVSETKMQITAGDVVIVSKLIDGTFPDYNRVIPTGNEHIALFDGADMGKAAERLQIVSAGLERGVKLAVAGDEIGLSIRGEGDGVDTVPCTYTGPAIEIGFGASYLAEIVRIFPAGDVSLALADAGSPALFRSPKDESLLAVLMPRRV